MKEKSTKLFSVFFAVCLSVSMFGVELFSPVKAGASQSNASQSVKVKTVAPQGVPGQGYTTPTLYNRAVSADSFGLTGYVSGLRGANYAYSGDTFRWHFDFTTDTAGGKDLAWKVYVNVYGYSAGSCTVVNGHGIPDCKHESNIFKADGRKIGFDFDIMLNATNPNIPEHVTLELQAKKYNASGKDLKGTSGFFNFDVSTTAQAQFLGKDASFPAYGKVKQNAIGVNYHVLFRGFLPQGTAYSPAEYQKSISCGVPGIEPQLNDLPTIENFYFVDLKCSGDVDTAHTTDGGQYQASFSFTPPGDSPQTVSETITTEATSYVAKATINGLGADSFVLCSGEMKSIDGTVCANSAENNGSGIIDTLVRNSTYTISNFVVYQDNKPVNIGTEKPIEFSDNASGTNDDDNIFYDQINDSLGSDYPDIVTMNTADKANQSVQIQTQNFAGKRKLHINITPKGLSGVYAIIDTTIAVQGAPIIKNASSGNTTSVTQPGTDTKYQIDDSAEINRNMVELYKMNAYPYLDSSGNDAILPYWADSYEVPDGLSISKSSGVDGLSVANLYSTYILAGTVGDVTKTYANTLYFSNAKGDINLNNSIKFHLDVYSLNIGNDAELNAIFPPVIQKGTDFENKTVELSNINAQKTDVDIDTTFGVSTKYKYNGNNSKIVTLQGSADTLGEGDVSETITVTLPNGSVVSNTAGYKVEVQSSSPAPDPDPTPSPAPGTLTKDDTKAVGSQGQFVSGFINGKFVLAKGYGTLSNLKISKGAKLIANNYKSTKKYIGKVVNVSGRISLDGKTKDFSQKYKVTKFTTKISINSKKQIVVKSYKNAVKVSGRVKVGSKYLKLKAGKMGKVSYKSKIKKGKKTIKYLGSSKLQKQAKKVKIVKA